MLGVWAVSALIGACTCSQTASLPAGPTARAAPAMIQVENAPQARPHSGLQHADLVYEYLTEGGITRFTAIYFSPSGSGNIGPVRSARLVTLRLQKAYGGVLFYSGASDHVLGLIQSSGIPALSESSDNSAYFFRDHNRVAPHNLYSSDDRIAAGVQKEGTKVGYPQPATGGALNSGDAVNRLQFQMTDSHSATFTYSADAHTYGYTNETGPEVDAANGNQPLAITNVVLVRVPHHDAGYTEDVLGENGIDFDLQGSGPADVYSGGHHVTANWNFSGDAPLQLTLNGKQLDLPKGLTWICLVDPTMTVSAS